MEKPEWKEFLLQFLKKDIDEETKALFLDFDGTMARFTKTADQTLAVHGFFSAVKIFLDKGYKVAIITGRPIEGTERIQLATGEVIKEENGVIEALKRSGADEELINRLYIFGSHGVQQRAHETDLEVQNDPKAEPFIEPQNQLLSHLQKLIENNHILKGLAISIEKKTLGATIHYREVAASQRQEVKDELGKLLSKVLPEKSNNMNFSPLEDQNNEDYKKFTYNSATESFEIRLNPGTTDVEINKGTSVKALAEKWDVKVAIAFGDDTTDLDMQKRLAELNLTATAFVGVKHSKTPDDIITGSTIVVEGQESSVGLLTQMANKAKRQTAAPAA
ncbi:MAG TPA: HAD hydrolase family protein [Ktedonobacteraceae bacterium]